jgi:hypothetical protein
MRPAFRLTFLAAALALGTASATEPATGDDAFDANYALAQRNERVGDYDARLAAVFYGQPQMAGLLDACFDMHPQRMAVHGYFDFPAGGGYHLVLRPSTPYAACIASAFEGFDVPEPPTRPYVHGFRYAPGDSIR